jgi:hypothetical protein
MIENIVAQLNLFSESLVQGVFPQLQVGPPQSSEIVAKAKVALKPKLNGGSRLQLLRCVSNVRIPINGLISKTRSVLINFFSEVQLDINRPNIQTG